MKKKIINFTYVSNVGKQYIFNEEEEIEETAFNALIGELWNQQLEYIEDVHQLFNPTRYLDSPFNQPEAFIEGNYFLTDHQNIKKEHSC
ncbi:hypothetical protein [Planococcus chinensis]|uniref:hypothetical protein n=1 Tax=Planococcus chinensis TaxID=272917 RepID=UPI001CC7156D|nr:hypothetical protein [Planococcus chinensis]